MSEKMPVPEKARSGRKGFFALAGVGAFVVWLFAQAQSGESQPTGKAYSAAEIIDAVSDNTRHKNGASVHAVEDSSSGDTAPSLPHVHSPLMRDPRVDDPFNNKWDA